MILYLLFLVVNVYCYQPLQSCAGYDVIKPPSNAQLPVYTYFPTWWNQNLTAPSYQNNTACRWTVMVPNTTFALFTMTADIGWDSSLIITDINGKSEIIMTSEQQLYAFVSNFTIDLQIGNEGDLTTFGFEVQWDVYPTPNPAYYNISKSDNALLFDEMLWENSVIITAESKVSLVAFPSTYTDLTPLLRLTLVFDGPGLDSPFLGTLYQAVRYNKPFISSGNQMTVFTFQQNYYVGSNFIVQDYYNVQNLAEIKGVTCFSQSSCPFTLNADNGPVAAMTLNTDDGNEYVKNLDLSGNAVLKVYLGDRKEGNDSNVIVTYNAAEAVSNIPQKFNGILMTYYLDNGTALVELAEDQNYTRWNDATAGREGFISSTYYGFNTFFQDTTEFIRGLYMNCSFVYHVNITHLGLENAGNLCISFSDESGTKDYIWSAENDTLSREFSTTASSMIVNYSTNGTSTSGFHLDFKISNERNNSQHRLAILPVILISILIFI